MTLSHARTSPLNCCKARSLLEKLLVILCSSVSTLSHFLDFLNCSPKAPKIKVTDWPVCIVTWLNILDSSATFNLIMCSKYIYSLSKELVILPWPNIVRIIREASMLVDRFLFDIGGGGGGFRVCTNSEVRDGKPSAKCVRDRRGRGLGEGCSVLLRNFDNRVI